MSKMIENSVEKLTSKAMLQRYSLLYIEEDATIAKAFLDIFEDSFQIVYVANNVSDALKIFHTQLPDIIVTDLQFSAMSGLEMIEIIRKEKPSIPIIVHSAFSDTNLLLGSLTLHVDNYLLKPIDKEKMNFALEKVAKILFVERAIIEANSTMQIIIDEIPDPILYISPNFDVVMMNESARKFGLEKSLQSKVKCYEISHHSSVVCSGDSYPCPVSFVKRTKTPTTLRHIHTTKEGEKRQIDVHMRPIFDENREIKAYLEIRHDITDYLEIQENLLHQTKELSHLSLHDPLTHLPNRRLISDRIEQIIAHKIRYGGQFGVYFVDLDNFKIINDSLGHAVGDLLLIAIAKEMQGIIRHSDTVGRIGGDEFVFVVENGPKKNHYEKVAQNIQHIFDKPFILNGKEVYSSCSIGISIYPKDGDTAETLLDNADTAMYKAKKSGGKQYHFFAPSIRDDVIRG
jgi:diguanylate cyclase (GGDEF)-like protein